jgi:hypothetical protein
MYWSGRAIGESWAVKPALTRSATIVSGGSRMCMGGPFCAASVKSTMTSRPPGRSAAARSRAYATRSAM